MKIPPRINILGHWYTIDSPDRVDDGDSRGKVICDNTSIQIAKGAGTGPFADSVRAEVLFHEIIHVIVFALDIKLAERGIRLLARGLFQVFHDNPDLDFREPKKRKQ